MTARTLLFASSPGPSGGQGSIRVYSFDVSAGTVALLSETAAEAPSYLAIDMATQRLYAANETPDGGLTTYAIDAEAGTLARLGRVSTMGDHPCQLTIVPSGRFVVASNFGIPEKDVVSGQSVVVLPVDGSGATGSARQLGSGPVAPYQLAPHAHSSVVSDDGRFVVVADLGNDELTCYPLTPAGALGAPSDVCKLPAGSGPRTVVLSRDRRSIFVSLELSSQLAVLDWDGEAGKLTLREIVSTVPSDHAEANYPSEVQVHGELVLLANRGHDSIAGFRIEGGSPRLVSLQPVAGHWPRSFSLSPDGRSMVVANQISGDVTIAGIGGDGMPEDFSLLVEMPNVTFVAFATLPA